MRRVAIVGAGIAGLALAETLRRRRSGSELEITVLEKSDRAGGNIRTDTIDGFLCERGPHGFLDSAPATLDLVRSIGIEHRLQLSGEAARRRFVFRRGALHQIPGSPGEFVTSGLLSWPGKLRILWEPFAATRPEADETIHAFATRRIGREAADVVIDPMVSGICAGDSRQLSLQACFPRLWQMEAAHGGLFRAALTLRRNGPRAPHGQGRAKGTGATRGSQPPAASGAPIGRLMSFVGGMEDLVHGLVAALPGTVQTNRRVRTMSEITGPARHSGDAHSRRRSGFLLDLQTNGTLRADVVVLADPASESAAIVQQIDPRLAALLRDMTTAPVVVVCLGYPACRLPAPVASLEGFGFLIPRGEGARILGVVWDSSIYPGRAPAGRVLIRAMLGGAHDPAAIAIPDETLLRTVRHDLKITMGLDLTPVMVQVYRHHLGIPQYTVGHSGRLEQIEAMARRHSGLFFAGNSYRGIAINNCVAEAGPLADRILAHLQSRRGGVR